MAKKKFKISFRLILSIVTLILVAIVVWNMREDFVRAFDYLKQTNIFFILLLIPEQLAMYYCAGEIFFSYMSAKKNAKKIPAPTLMRIAFELNFVNNAIPSGGVSGMAYISWRLKEFGSTPGQTSFMYVLRYGITVCANQLQTLVAILCLALAGGITAGAAWVIWLTIFMALGILVLIAVIIVIASSKKRIKWFGQVVTKFVNGVVRIFSFGKKRKVLKEEVVNDFMDDLHGDLLMAKHNKRILIKPIIWGIVYSFLEVATYWLVGISMGHVEILPQIMIGEALASIIGAVLVTPGGVGGYEGAMILVMTTLGVDVALATAVVITTRVVVLVGTVASGYGFYQHAISKLGKKRESRDDAR